jgi:hypothetical protein
MEIGEWFGGIGSKMFQENHLNLNFWNIDLRSSAKVYDIYQAEESGKFEA